MACISAMVKILLHIICSSSRHYDLWDHLTYDRYKGNERLLCHTNSLIGCIAAHASIEKRTFDSDVML